MYLVISSFNFQFRHWGGLPASNSSTLQPQTVVLFFVHRIYLKILLILGTRASTMADIFKWARKWKRRVFARYQIDAEILPNFVHITRNPFFRRIYCNNLQWNYNIWRFWTYFKLRRSLRMHRTDPYFQNRIQESALRKEKMGNILNYNVVTFKSVDNRAEYGVVFWQYNVYGANYEQISFR